MSDEDLVAELLTRKGRKTAAESGKRGAAQSAGDARGAAGREDRGSKGGAERRAEETGAQFAPLADGSARDGEG